MDTDITPRQIVDNYQSHMKSVGDYSFTVIENDPQNMHYIDIKYRRPYQYILKYRSDPVNLIWTQSIQNLTLVKYFPRDNSADILVIGDPEKCFPGILDPNQQVSPLMRSWDFHLAQNVPGKVNGRETFVIEGNNSGSTDCFGEGINGTVRIWIDKEFWLVTKIQAFDSSRTLKENLEVKDITVNSGISEAEFIIKIPEGARIHHPKPFC